jgi:hypothetical protein
MGPTASNEKMAPRLFVNVLSRSLRSGRIRPRLKSLATQTPSTFQSERGELPTLVALVGGGQRPLPPQGLSPPSLRAPDFGLARRVSVGAAKFRILCVLSLELSGEW